MTRISKNYWKHGRPAMSVRYSSSGEKYYRLEKSYINRKKRVKRY